MKGKYPRATQYCKGCDQSLVAIGKKCKICGKRMEGKKLEKLSTDKILKISLSEN